MELVVCETVRVPDKVDDAVDERVAVDEAVLAFEVVAVDVNVEMEDSEGVGVALDDAVLVLEDDAGTDVVGVTDDAICEMEEVPEKLAELVKVGSENETVASTEGVRVESCENVTVVDNAEEIVTVIVDVAVAERVATAVAVAAEENDADAVGTEERVAVTVAETAGENEAVAVVIDERVALPVAAATEENVEEKLVDAEVPGEAKDVDVPAAMLEGVPVGCVVAETDAVSEDKALEALVKVLEDVAVGRDDAVAAAEAESVARASEVLVAVIAVVAVLVADTVVVAMPEREPVFDAV